MVLKQSPIREPYGIVLVLMFFMSLFAFFRSPGELSTMLPIFIIPLFYGIASLLLAKLVQETYEKLKQERSRVLFVIAFWAFRFWMLFVHAIFISVIMFSVDQSFQLFALILCMAFFHACFGGLTLMMEKNPLLGVNIPWQGPTEKEWETVNKVASKTMLIASAVLFLMLPFMPLLEARYFEITIISVFLVLFSPIIVASFYSAFLQKRIKNKEQEVLK